MSVKINSLVFNFTPEILIYFVEALTLGYVYALIYMLKNVCRLLVQPVLLPTKWIVKLPKIPRCLEVEHIILFGIWVSINKTLFRARVKF